MGYASRDPRPLRKIAIVDEQTIGIIANRVPAPTGIPPGNIATDSDHDFVSTEERTFWDEKQQALGFTPVSELAVSGKQDTLVSGSTIKTINGESVLGGGNIVVSGSGGLTIAQIRRIC